MFKRLLSIVLIISMLIGMSTISFADSQPRIGISLNEGEFYSEEGLVMCPLRKIAEELNYSVKWNGEEQSIELSKESERVNLKIGESLIKVNGNELNLKSKPVIKDGKTYVPLELFSTLNLIVGWDNKLQKLKINLPRENEKEFFKVSDKEEISQKLDTYLKDLQEHQNFHGSVLVAKEGKVLLSQGYGFADFEQNTLNKSQTKFAIGSVTKQFTAMMIMQLSEKGLIDIEDKVSKYMPEFPNGDIITIHNLLTHTSGLFNYTDLNEFFTLTYENDDPYNMVKLIEDIPLEFEPGAQFKYSNTNYLLLGIIVEKITDMSYEKYLQENILEPLNMESTGICYGENNGLHDATAYLGYLEVTPVDDELLLSKAYGAGSMYSTVEDLYRWDQALNTEKIVKKETMDKIFTDYITIPRIGSYAYGWMIGDTIIGEKIFHGGNTLGFSSNIVRYVDEDLTIIILTNNGYYNVSSLTDVLTSIVFNWEYEMPEVIKEIKIEDKDLYKKYEGQYSFIEGTFINIIEHENKLYAQVTDQGAFEIFPKTTEEFFAKIVDASIKFIKDDKDEVNQFVFEQLGLEIVCIRVE